jgi:hypothetical protein
MALAAAPHAAAAEGRAAAAAAVLRRIERHDFGADLRLLGAAAPPPRAWLELEAAVAAAPPGRARAALRAALAPRARRLPPLPARGEPRCCSLAGAPRGRRFAARPLNALLAALFARVPPGAQAAGLPPIALSRFDLHHAHLFLADPEEEEGEEGCGGGRHRHRRLGLLFHAKEYPRADADAFPADLGRCQRGSPLAYDAAAMDWRNVVYFAGALAALDLGPGGPLHALLLMDGLREARTVLESDFGAPLAEVYHAEAAERRPAHRLFVLAP